MPAGAHRSDATTVATSDPAASVKLDASAIDCGWDPVTGTLWPTVKVYRPYDAGLKVTARILLDFTAKPPRSLGVGRVLPDGSTNQKGFIDGPSGTTGVEPMETGDGYWIRPWGGRFGDGGVGGAKLAAGKKYKLRLIMFDFEAGTNWLEDFACATAGPFKMVKKSFSASKFAKGKQKLSLTGVLSDLGAAASPSLTTTCDPAVSGQAGPVSASFCWASADAEDESWYPQGVAGSFESGKNGDGRWSGVPLGHEVLLVSWYQREGGHGTRLAIVDRSTTPHRYLFVNLMEPCPKGTVCPTGYRPLTESHVGGLAWAGKYLYVAETNKGLRVFDLTAFYREAGPVYSLPQVMSFEQDDTCPTPVKGLASTAPCELKFSFVSTANGAPYRLVSSEFLDDNGDHGDGARIVSWPLSSTGLLDTSASGRNKQKVELIAGAELNEFQGVVANGSVTVLSSSFGSDNGGRTTRVATATPLGGNAPVVKDAPSGIEDMASSQAAGVVWAIAEFPGRRWVWSRPFSDVFG